jgi:hypothetical protein
MATLDVLRDRAKSMGFTLKFDEDEKVYDLVDDRAYSNVLHTEDAGQIESYLREVKAHREAPS